MALSRAFDQRTIDDLLFLYKIHGKKKYMSRWLDLSSDGVLRFARLIGAGLATFTISVQDENGSEHFYDFWAYPENSSPTHQQISGGKYRVYLTDKGSMLVEACISGNKEEVEKALAWSSE